MRRLATRSLLILLLLVDATAAAEPAPGLSQTLSPALSPELVRLFDLVEHRARLMPDVARWKHHAGRPVTDPEREALLLERASATAAATGLDATGARRFVDAQMAISRRVQQAALERWGDAVPRGGPDLVADLRPAIAATTTALLEILPRVLPLLRERTEVLRGDLTARLAPLGATSTEIDALVAALASLRAAPTPPSDPVARIRAAGVLRVGTTGDYAPFSAIDTDGDGDGDGDGDRRGIDIDLARDLAAHLGVDVAFVATSWPTLMADLAAGRFDVAMSGISRTTERALAADFSVPYHVGGKTPIVRCTDLARFDSLAAIDAEGVRAIVNPGGTNERFARSRLTRADLRVFDDNTRVFDEIAEGRADVMFTDAIEVRLRTARDARLCAALPGRTLTYQEKAVLLPAAADDRLRRFVDLWLAQRLGDGFVAARFAAHLGTPGEPAGGPEAAR